MGDRYRSVLSDAPLSYAVSAEVDGNIWYPTDGITTVRAAYLASSLADPTEPDWQDGVFELTAAGTIRALVSQAPGVGCWYEWVEVNDPPTGARPVEMVGRVFVR